MGENKHIEELDAFAKKYVKEIKGENAPINFTANLMHEIKGLEIKKVIKSSPLISKKVWFLLLAAFVSLFFIPFKSREEKLVNMPELDFSFLQKFHLSNLFGELSISSTMFYTFLFFGIMIFIQIIYLKNHFNKKYD